MSSIFKIFSKEDCNFYYDGKLQGYITGNSEKAFRFEVERKGSYRVKFVHSLYGSELMMNLNIEADEEKVVDIDFEEVITLDHVSETIIYFNRYYKTNDFGDPTVSDYVKRENAEVDAKVKELIKDSMDIIDRLPRPFAANATCETVKKDVINIATDLAAALKKAKRLYFSAKAKEIRSHYTYNPYLMMPTEWKFMWGFMDWNGNEVIPCIYDRADSFCGNYARVYLDGWGLIDMNGKEVVPCKYSDIGSCSEGFACIKKDGKWGYVDIESGKELVIGLYDFVYIFCEGIARVEKDNKYGFIDKTGKEIAPCIFGATSFFREGLAVVNKNGKCGYIDMTGNVVIPFVYEGAREFIDGFAPVKKNDKYGFIDKTGTEVVPCIYDNARIHDVDHYFVEGYVQVKNNDKWGLVDRIGTEVVPCIYDCLWDSDGERSYFSRATENGYIHGRVYMNGIEEVN